MSRETEPDRPWGDAVVTGGKLLAAKPGVPNNWGRWGDDDERGTLNLLTPERIRRAAALVVDGQVHSLSLPMGRSASVLGTRSPAVVTLLGSSADTLGGRPAPHGVQSTDDMIVSPLQTATHIDGLAHIACDDVLYNGFWAGTTNARDGATRLGGEHLAAAGISGRAVLVDVPRFMELDPYRGVNDVRALESTLAAQGVSVEPGDILLVRTGWMAAYSAAPSPRRRCAGLAPSVAGWLAERDVALVACDNRSVEAVPNPEGDAVLPFHVSALRDLGMPLGELFVLDAAAQHCAETGRYAGFLSIGPLPITGAAGSPVNPLFHT
jgi:kynurenine formamidase